MPSILEVLPNIGEPFQGSEARQSESSLPRKMLQTGLYAFYQPK